MFCVLWSFVMSLGIVILGVCGWGLAVTAVVALRHLRIISFDPREDPFFLLSFVAPTLLTLLALATFQIPLCMSLIRNRRYATLVGALSSGTVVGLSFFFFMVLAWVMY